MIRVNKPCYFLSLEVDLTIASSRAMYRSAVNTSIADTTGKTALIVNALPSGLDMNIQRMKPCNPNNINELSVHMRICTILCL